LNHNLLLPLRILTNTTPRREFPRKHLCGLFQVDPEEVEAVDVGGVFALGPFGAFDGDLGEGAGGSRVDRGGGGRWAGRRGR